ncbi:hypothetical protein SAMN05216276_101675 [Streptosporangium subroseum]|uniref:Uncharacterized protein n=1 Tax=Streptosporangium subroseum TaxID=106412 RepID=A0A239HE78_9ACTN|nr:hypothetical protein [Streptosporangium subroseum]SNS79461.1 hypothetical protein SAMN05216276_101675 [Streptosporangium subroseum]
MAAKEMPIREKIEPGESGDITLDMLKSALADTKPELIENAAGEFRSAMTNLKSLIDCLDRHLDSFDKNWTAGEDAKMVKTQFRRLRESAQSVVDAIVGPNPPGMMGPYVPTGVAPALEMYSSTLKEFRGDNVPQSADRDISFLEGAYEGGTVGAIGGAGVGVFAGGVGAVPGAVIGAVGGTIVGGVTTLFTDGPFQNMFGDSKAEQDLKAAKEHLRKLTQATASVNEAFPHSVKTDIPEFTPLGFTPPNAGAPPGSAYRPGGPGPYPPAGVQSYAPASGGNDFTTPGFGLNGDGPGGPGGGTPGVNGPGWNPSDPNGPGANGPGANEPGWNEPGANGPDANGPGSDGPGANGGTGVGGADGTGSGTNGGTGVGAYPSGDPGRDTKLADYTPQTPGLAAQQNHPGNSGQQGYPGSGSGNSATGIGAPTPGGAVGYGAGGGGGATSGGSAGGAGSGSGADSRGMGSARALSASTGSAMPLIPPGGTGTSEGDEERERSTWLLEDEDLFMSDRPVTSPLIDGAPKGKA